MQLNKILASQLDLFSEIANHRLQQILATLVSKYHVGADTILLSWV
jgi:hypothetical protein